jgi:hypothetical protein
MDARTWRRPGGAGAGAAVVLALLLPLVTATGAGAATGFGEDPKDTATGLDVETLSFTSDASSITHTVTTWTDMPTGGLAQVGWLLDTDGDLVDDFVVGAFHDGTGWAGAVFDTGLNPLGAATVTQTGPRSLRVAFQRSAVGGPAAYSFYVVTRHDVDGDGSFQASEIDEAPDGGVLFDGTPVFRLAGTNRVATAIAASVSGFGDGQAGAVVLARADDFPDALAGTPLAIATSAPLLLTPAAALDQAVDAEIRRVLPRGRTVYLLGGTAALSDGIAGRLRDLGYAVTRFAGANRYETALRIAEDGLGNPATLLLTTGTGFADALSAGAAAGSRGGAVLLTAGATLPPSVAAYLQAHPSATRYAIGGPAAAADPSATPIAGRDRYETSRLVAQAFFAEPGGAAIASGVTYPDALSGGARTGGLAPLLLTDPTALTPGIRDYLAANRSSLELVAVFGGRAAISEAVRQAAERAIN